MTRCPASWLGCHRYEAQYDEVPDVEAIKAATAMVVSAHEQRAEVSIGTNRNVYVQSVCRHCGDVIDRLEK